MGWGGVVAHEILVSAQGPLVLGFLGFWVWELRVWGQGLTIKILHKIGMVKLEEKNPEIISYI